MYKNSFGLALAVLASLLFTVGGAVQAGEIIFAEDIKQNVITKEVLVRAADNVIVLVDSSSSMGETDKNRTKMNYELEREALLSGFQRLPDLGYNIGVYRFTPWEAVYPIQQTSPAAVAAALSKLPDKPAGPTPLIEGLDELEKVLKGLSGKTFVYLFSDGGYIKGKNRPSPWEKTAMLAHDYDVCFQLIDYSAGEREKRIVADMAKANWCSRVIPFDSYVTQPYYGILPLYYTRWDTEIESLSEKRVAGYKVNNVLFDVDQHDLTPAAKEGLDQVGKFMGEHPSAYAVLFGFTDETGKSEYNWQLSRRRAESVANYLYYNFNLGPDRVIPHWYGAANPIASNDTEAGRAKNRRVEISIGGL
ncbi:MAG: OmpA family protein [Desulfobacterales bacterium]|jgi:OOP family OmpA-OmpF porin